MTQLPSRRSALLLLAGAAMPAVARAQDPTTGPQATPPVPPVASPAPPPVNPIRPPPAPITAIDKTKAYYVFFDQPIDVASMRTMRRQLATLVEAGVSDITLVLNSPGGLIEPMLITYSFILALPAKINTHAQGFVQSAATLLFLAGQERSADRNARFLFHPSQSPVSGVMSEQQIHERLTAFDVIADVMAQIYRDRSNLTPAEITRFAHEEVIYTADQALASGVVQKVADLRIPGEGKAKIMFLG
jgi:ATP-dependent protease ClpP protease subunit